LISKAKICRSTFKTLIIFSQIYKLKIECINQSTRTGVALNHLDLAGSNSRYSEMSFVIIWATPKWWKWTFHSSKCQKTLIQPPMFMMILLTKLSKCKMQTAWNQLVAWLRANFISLSIQFKMTKCLRCLDRWYKAKDLAKCLTQINKIKL